MPGLLFVDEAPVAASHPNRADIGCFAGFVRLRQPFTPGADLLRWLDEQGWSKGPYRRPGYPQLLDVPVPIESWQAFNDLFDWGDRTGDGINGAAYLGAAVRSFFAQGGRKCYVVRMGDPWAALAPRSVRAPRVAQLVPGYPVQFQPSPADRSSWSGVGHLFGLPDISFLCVPDLPDALAADRQPVEVPPDPPPAPEQFVECSTGETPPEPDRSLRGVPIPRCDEVGFAEWANAIHLIGDMLARQRREVQFVAAIPQPAARSDAEGSVFRFLVGQCSDGPLASALAAAPAGIATAFVQFVFPWVKSPGSSALPEQAEPGDGALAGVLARNALTRGSYRSAANLDLKDVYDFVPVLGREAWNTKAGAYTFPERVTLVGPTPSGPRVLSDVTTSLNESYRPACVNRLVSAIVRAARRVGEDSTFEPSGEPLWAQLRGRLNDLLRGLYKAGALRGDTAASAFSVRCDRSTMSQSDLDSGRVIAIVQFEASPPIDTISVVLAFQADRQVAVLSEGA